MITHNLPEGTLVIDPSGGVIVEVNGTMIVEVPVQYRAKDGTIEVGNVYVGTEPMATLVREAHRWARLRAQSAHNRGNSGENGRRYLTVVP